MASYLLYDLWVKNKILLMPFGPTAVLLRIHLAVNLGTSILKSDSLLHQHQNHLRNGMWGSGNLYFTKVPGDL
jgi:hypothetical protein